MLYMMEDIPRSWPSTIGKNETVGGEKDTEGIGRSPCSNDDTL